MGTHIMAKTDDVADSDPIKLDARWLCLVGDGSRGTQYEDNWEELQKQYHKHKAKKARKKVKKAQQVGKDGTQQKETSAEDEGEDPLSRSRDQYYLYLQIRSFLNNKVKIVTQKGNKSLLHQQMKVTKTVLKITEEWYEERKEEILGAGLPQWDSSESDSAVSALN